MEGKKSIKQRVKDGWKWTKQKVKTGYDWGMENKETVAIVAPLIAGTFIELVKASKRKGILEEQRRLKENFIYDPRHHHYYETKRKMTTDEYLIYDERYTRGEPVGEILKDMGVLKR